MESYLVSPDEVRAIVREFHTRVIKPLCDTHRLKRDHCAIVVVWGSGDLIYDPEEMFADLFLPEGKTEPDRDFLKFARAKVSLAARTGTDTNIVIQQAPELLIEEDFPYGGGIVFGGWIIAISAFEAYDDEALAHQLGWELRRFAYAKLAAVPSGTLFLGDEKHQAGQGR